MAWLVFVCFSSLVETLNDTDYPVWLHFCDLPRYGEREKKPSEFLLTFFFVFEPGLPAQQANVLSITELPIGSPSLWFLVPYFVVFYSIGNFATETEIVPKI